MTIYFLVAQYAYCTRQQTFNYSTKEEIWNLYDYLVVSLDLLINFAPIYGFLLTNNKDES